MKWIWAVLMLGWLGAHAQEEYTVADGSSTECTGMLTDTGGAGDDYSGEEFFVFTVELGVPIHITFLSDVCLESPFDVLEVYDGPPATGVLLGQITGIDYTPAPLLATSGLATFIFQSDVSVNYCGFELLWEGDAPPPTAPTLTADEPACGDLGLTWHINPSVPCAAFIPDSVVVSGGIAVGAAEPVCEGDSATGFFLPFVDGPLEANCTWDVTWGLGLTDACDSTHVFEVAGSVLGSDCAASGAWLDPVSAVCEGACDTLWWAPTGCFGASWVWTVTAGGTVVDTPDSAGIVVCPEELVTVTLVATEDSTGAVTAFSWEVGVEEVTLLTELPPALCASDPVELLAVPEGGTWSGDAVQSGGSWWLDVSGGLAEVTYTSPLGCALDTATQVVFVDAGGPYASCFGAPPFEVDGTDGVWSGAVISPGGTVITALAGTHELVLTYEGCADTTFVEMVEELPAIQLGSVCANGEEVVLPVVAEAGVWTGPGLVAGGTAFDPSLVPVGVAEWACELTGCAQPAVGEVLAIEAAPDATACPAGDLVELVGAAPAGGVWSGPGVSTTGWFDPAVAGAGEVTLTYAAPNGCVAETVVVNETTSVALDSLATCGTASPVELVGLPACGVWSGPGVSDAGCVAAFDPAIAGPGEYAVTYALNGCSAELAVVVWPGSVAIPEVAVCSTTAPVELAPDDLLEGGVWEGVGVDPVTGVFTPSEGLPSGAVTYVAPGGCISSAVLQSEPWQQVEPVGGVVDTLCAGTVFDPEWSTGEATWTWAGEPGAAVLVDTLVPAAYAVEAVWTGTFCTSDTAFEVVIPEPLEATVSVADDLICAGEMAEVAYGAVGGNPAVHSWELTAPLPWVPDSSMWWVAEVSDGCGIPDADSVWVNVIQAAGLQLSTPDTACFEGAAEVLGWILPEAPWELTWDTTAVVPDDAANDTTWWVLDAAAGSSVPWTVTWPEEGCTGSGVFVVPGHPEVTADVNWPADCVPWDALPVGLAIEGGGATDVEWWVREPGTGVVLDQIQGETALWNPQLPGEVLVQVTASIDGDCAVSASNTVCVLSPQQWFLADRFSPNGDGLNEHLGVRGHPMDAFRMRILNRWGELVADLNAPQPGWDGQFRGSPAPTGVYVVQLEMTFTDGSTVTTERHVTLVR